MTLVNDRLVHLRGDHMDHVVNAVAVMDVTGASGAPRHPTTVDEALGWAHVFRALREAGEEIRVRLIDGTVATGRGGRRRDFVRLTAGSARDQVMVPFDAIAVVSGRT